MKDSYGQRHRALITVFVSIHAVSMVVNSRVHALCVRRLLGPDPTTGPSLRMPYYHGVHNCPLSQHCSLLRAVNRRRQPPASLPAATSPHATSSHAHSSRRQLREPDLLSNASQAASPPCHPKHTVALVPRLNRPVPRLPRPPHPGTSAH